MKIYTKKGDAGETGLYGGTRVSKDHLRILAYGTLDELNSCLGVALVQLSSASNFDLMRKELLAIQSELFQLGAELATPRGGTLKTAPVTAKEIEWLEKRIDAMEERLAPLKNFILPGGTQASAQLHLARTISRRAEREAVTLHREEPLRAEVLQYLNRLADALFVYARYANFLEGAQDVPWVARSTT